MVKKVKFRSVGDPRLVFVVCKKIRSIMLNAEVIHAVATPQEIKRIRFWLANDERVEK